MTPARFRQTYRVKCDCLDWLEAVTYARNQWGALRRDTTDGGLTIDNITAEGTLRHQTIARKTWLFLGKRTRVAKNVSQRFLRRPG